MEVIMPYKVIHRQITTLYGMITGRILPIPLSKTYLDKLDKFMEDQLQQYIKLNLYLSVRRTWTS